MRHKIEAKKQVFWNIFQSTVKEEKNELILASTFVKILESHSKDKIESQLTDEIFSAAQKSFLLRIKC